MDRTAGTATPHELGFPGGSIPADEERRLAALRRYEILDSPPEEAFDRITRLAVQLLDAPVSFIGLTDEGRQWIKSFCGLEVRQLDGRSGPCAHAILHHDPLVLLDTSRDPYFCTNELVTGPPHIRFYAAAPLTTPDGHRIGNLCVFGPEPREAFTDRQRAALVDLAAVAMDELELRLALRRSAASEEMLYALTADLERRVEQRTAELEARNAEQETFVYTVSHDLRQPLLALEGMGELLREAVQAGDAAETEYLVDRVHQNTHKMGRLLNDLLALSRVGWNAAEAEVLDLGELLRAVLSDLEPQLASRGVRVDLPSGWPDVLYPASEAYQVLANLLGNAAKFAGRPGEAPRVSLGWTAQAGQVTVRVEDNGPGIAPAYRERVFGLFQKLDAKAEGTGVGLAIVRRIAERHGGRAWIEDSELGGARFLVSLRSS